MPNSLLAVQDCVNSPYQAVFSSLVLRERKKVRNGINDMRNLMIYSFHPVLSGKLNYKVTMGWSCSLTKV
jgi:hypothetical protein